MPPVIRVALDTLGCKLNQADTEAMARRLAEAGFCLVSPDEQYDVYVLNSCTVTAVADTKARRLLRLAYRRSPQAALILTGCFPESITSKVKELSNLKLILPGRKQLELVRKISELGYSGGSASGLTGLSRTRAFVKAQEGCSNLCAYCVVPYMRGKEVSRPPGEVVKEVRRCVSEGYQEVVLTGTEIGAYRYDGVGLEALLGLILAETGIARLRVSSLQPPEITTSLLKLWENPRLCPHFHLSLQSGSDAVLRRMRRRYDSMGYERVVTTIRELVAGAAITTDVIAGFPGETASEFEESLLVCERLGFARIHVFTFSPRPGTAAASMPGQVTEQVKKLRTGHLLELARESARQFQAGFLEQRLDVLWEKEKNGVWSGYTANYLRIYARSIEMLANRITKAELLKLYKDGVLGEVRE